MRAHKIFIAMTFLAAALSVMAQNESDSVQLESAVKPKGFKLFLQKIAEVDTNYIELNRYNCTVMMLGEKRYSFYRLSAKNEEGHRQQLDFMPSSPFKVGPYFGYSLFFLGYTFDLGAKRYSFDRSNFYLSLYSRLFGIDYYFESGTNNYRIRSVKGFGDEVNRRARDIAFRGMSTYLQNWHLYYIFNNKHFSYPAAYSQSTRQKRSAGSFILGFNYSKERVNFDHTQLPSYILYDSEGNEQLGENLKITSVKYRDYSLSLGYAYNWVFARNWLCNGTLSPTVGYNLSEGQQFSTKETLFNLDALNLDIIGRASVVWNNAHFYAGAAAVGHTYGYKKPTFSIRNARVTLSIYAGVNFWRKKQK